MRQPLEGRVAIPTSCRVRHRDGLVRQELLESDGVNLKRVVYILTELL